jgi:hypothetical protein
VGPTGADGPALGGTLIVSGPLVSNVSTVSTASTSASCTGGRIMLSGGALMTTTDTPDLIQLVASYPSGPTTWTVTGTAGIKNNKVWTIQAFAVCSA